MTILAFVCVHTCMYVLCIHNCLWDHSEFPVLENKMKKRPDTCMCADEKCVVKGGQECLLCYLVRNLKYKSVLTKDQDLLDQANSPSSCPGPCLPKCQDV